ncbi:class I SAM-dependent DNA methyltransferase [Sediminimonas qiaohouensis]|uniref:class I SAM-dependent DNA methyltransferase n=1 Tax=Sediminimonas qiaohouensis TaxID=552061 RepID=UPI000407DE35|nr:DNA methyltransferase [Sediminimonas qiaohouensis]
MNAVEIEEAISRLAEQPFDAEEFPFAFLEAFGNKATTIKRLRSGASNKSDIGGVLQINNIHIKVCEEGQVSDTIRALRESPATKNARNRVKFILATDGITLEAEDLSSDIAPIVCPFEDFPDHFGFFLPLAGISTVKQIRESAFDIKATGRLNRLYVELLKDNPEWGTAERRHDMNHFMARLIFCFFAEDTDIFVKADQFTSTIEQMSAPDSTNTHEVISTLFRAMNTKVEERDAANIPRWASDFPYVNGGLFSQSVDVPRFSKIARSYLLHIGNLDWKKINPDIFGSMIQAVADDEERGALGMHYTSVPNILKVLNPLFLDDLHEKLNEAGDNARKLLNLRNRMARIRVFDPACGSGNFLVIAYKEMRAIEAEINKRRGEPDRRTDIPLTNFRGIELRDFSAEVARLALIIAEYQCDVLYRGQREALRDFLPLDAMNWITCGNALRIDWLSICPPTRTGVKMHGDDLFSMPLDQAEIDFENEGGETYICGNPPYLGSRNQNDDQKSDLKSALNGRISSYKSLDYVSGWMVKAADYCRLVPAMFAFVTTNSMNQGLQVPLLWPTILDGGLKIFFAHKSFKWSNLAKNSAGVTVSVVGVGPSKFFGKGRIFDSNSVAEVPDINPYLVPAETRYVEGARRSISGLNAMVFGNMPRDGGHLSFDQTEKNTALNLDARTERYIFRYVGSQEMIGGIVRYCLWIEDSDASDAAAIPFVKARLESVSKSRGQSSASSTRDFARKPHRFVQSPGVGIDHTILVAGVSSERREYLPVDFVPNGYVASNLLFAIFDGPLWNVSLIASKLHLVWIASVCGKMKTDYRYSNTLGWNTFPVPKLTQKNKSDLSRCAEEILLAREAHFPATIADLYDPEKMPDDLRAAHDRNDEVLERIYIGRRFRNDTERLEKLFELYTKMTSGKERMRQAQGAQG